MIEAVLSIIIAVLGIVATWLNRKKVHVDGKIEKAMDITSRALQTDFQFRTHLINGDYKKLQEDMDRISSDMRALRGVLGKSSTPKAS